MNIPYTERFLRRYQKFFTNPKELEDFKWDIESFYTGVFEEGRKEGQKQIKEEIRNFLEIEKAE